MPRPLTRRARLAIAVATVPLSLASARAASVSWASPVSGQWVDSANWSPAAVPVSGDSVTIDAPGAYTVTLDEGTSVGPVTLNAPDAILSIAKSPYYASIYIYTGPFAVPAGTLAIRSSNGIETHISPTSFTNAGTVTFDADKMSSSPTQVSADIFTGSGAVLNSGTIETHDAPRPSPPTTPYYPLNYSFTGSTGATFTNTGTLRAVGASSLDLSNYTFNQNAGSLDGEIELFSSTLNYNGGSCSTTIPVYLEYSTLKIAPTATAGNFVLSSPYGGNSSIASNIPAGNTVSIWIDSTARWTGTGSFTNAGRLVVGYYPWVASTTTTSPSLYVGSSATLLNTGTLELNSPNLPAVSFTGSITNQGAVIVNPSNTTYSNVTTRVFGSFNQNGGSLTIDPATTLSLFKPNDYTNVGFYFNGGTVSGPVVLKDSTVHFAAGLANTGGGTFSYSATVASNPATPFTGNIPSGATFVHVNGTAASSFSLPSFTNAGALRTSYTNGTSRPAYTLASGSGTLTNTGSLGGTVNGVDRGINLAIAGILTNTGDIKAYGLILGTGSKFNQNAGTLDVDTSCIINGGTFNYNGGALTGQPVTLMGSTLSIAPGTAPASFTFPSANSTLHGTITAGAAVAIDSAVTVPYGTVSGTVSVIADPFTNAGTLSLAATYAVEKSTLTVTGSGVLTNTGTLSVTQGKGGTRTVNANIVNSGSFSVGLGATLTLAGSLTTSTPLDLQGTLNLKTGPLLWSYADISPIDTLRSLLASSHLTSSSADTTHRLSYLDTGTQLQVRLSLSGDTNFDGTITPDDYVLLDRSFAMNLSNAHWTDGDFNYDGAIDAADYLLIDTTLGQTQGFDPEFLAERESQFGDTYVQTLIASVPEPISLSLLILPALTLQRRRL